MNTAENNVLASDAEGVERELCRICLEPNVPGATFCKDCGAPLSSYAATGPFESLFTEGHVYRQAAEHPQKLIVLLGMWVIFGGLEVVGVSLIVLNFTKIGSLFYFVFGVGIVGISSAIL